MENIDLTAARLIKNDNKEGFVPISRHMERDYKTHLQNCQVKAFHENSDLKKAENAAQLCFKPYLMMQKKSLEALSPVKRKFMSCMSRNKRLINEESVSHNSVFQECLSQYKKDMPKYNAKLVQLNLTRL